MSETEPLSIIEAELYEVLASKELSFGCKAIALVDNKNYPGHNEPPSIIREVVVLGVHEDNKKGKTFSCIDEDWKLAHSRRKAEKIIGHEPTLNDIMLQLGEMWNNSCFLDNTLYIKVMCRVSSIETKLEYDLTKSFDSQTEETKRKLHSLICVK